LLSKKALAAVLGHHICYQIKGASSILLHHLEVNHSVLFLKLLLWKTENKRDGLQIRASKAGF